MMYINNKSQILALLKGDPGITPHIGENGHWFIGDTDTGVQAEGQAKPGITPHIGPEGTWWIGDEDTYILAVPPVPRVGSDGYWWLDDDCTYVRAKGMDGITPHIGENGHWWIGDTDTGVSAVGRAEPGITPHIGPEGTWWIGDEDTGVQAEAKNYNTPIRTERVVGQWLVGGQSVVEVRPDLEEGRTYFIEDVPFVAERVVIEGCSGVVPPVPLRFSVGEREFELSLAYDPAEGTVFGYLQESGSSGPRDVTVTMYHTSGALEPRIGENGNWWIGDKDTGVRAEAVNYNTPVRTERVFGQWTFGGKYNSAEVHLDLEEGQTYFIEDVPFVAGRVVEDGCSGVVPLQTVQFSVGERVFMLSRISNPSKGTIRGFMWEEDGSSQQDVTVTMYYASGALEPRIGENGNWWIGDKDTGVQAEGKDGYTPYIGANGNWWIGGIDYETGMPFETDLGYKATGTPIKGVDYFTEADKEELVADVISALPVYEGEVESV